MVELNFRELSWLGIEGPNIGSVPKFQVETSRILVLTTTLDAQEILLIMKMNLSEEMMKRIKLERGGNQDALQLKTCVQQEIDEINFETTSNLLLLEDDVALEQAIIPSQVENNQSHSCQVNPSDVLIVDQSVQYFDEKEAKFSLVLSSDHYWSDDEYDDTDDEYTYTYEEVTASSSDDE